MNGERYYAFKPPQGSVRFFALDSNYMDKAQLAWLEKELAASDSAWKICFFHHPIYSSGDTHGANVALREQVEPLFLKYGVSLVLTGHEHFYERMKPQKGINYIVAGSAAKAASRGHRKLRSDRKGIRRGLRIHADGDRRRRAALPDNHRCRPHRGFR